MVHRYAGFLVPDPAGTVTAINAVADRIDPDREFADLADRTIASLPAEVVE